MNRDLIGKTYAQAEVVEVDRARIARYRSATNADDIAAYDGDAMVAPPLLLSVLATGALTAPLLDGDLGVDLLRLTHLEHDVRVLKAAPAGTRVGARSRIVDVERRPAGEVLVVEVGLADEEGAALLEVTARFLVKAPRTKPDLAAGGAVDERAPGVAFVGVEQVALYQSRRYADAIGDPNPIHTDPDIARNAGYPDVVLPGLCTMAFVENAVVRHLDGNVGRLARLTARFERPVLMGDALSIQATRASNDALALRVENQDGIPVLIDGRAELR